MKNKQVAGRQKGVQSGWTMVELLVVITVVVILSAIGLAGLSRVQQTTSRKNAETQREVLNSGIDQFLATYGSMPDKEDLSGHVLYAALTGDGAGADGIPCTGDDTVPDGQPDRSGMSPFVDPGGKHPIAVATRGSGRVLLDPYGRPWRYRGGALANNPRADIWSAGHDGADGTADDITNW